MTLGRFAVAVTFGAALSACPSPGVLPCTGGTGFGTGGAGGSFAEKVELTDVPLSQPLSVPASFDCSGQATVAASVAVEVLGPDNRPVDHQSSAPSTDPQGRAYSTVVTFTPTAPGTYHLTAVFEPSLGQVQTDVWVARDVRARTAATVGTGPHVLGCLQFAATAHGTVLCRRAGPNVPLDALHAQGAAESLPQAGLPADDLAVHGDAVWVVSGDDVLRYVDTGAATMSRTTASCRTAGPARLLAVTDDAALVTVSGQLWRLSLASAACDDTALWPNPFGTYPVLAAWDGERVLLGATRAHQLATLQPDGGSQVTTVPGVPVAAGPQGLWVEDQGQMSLLPLDGGAGQTMTLPVGWATDDFNGALGTPSTAVSALPVLRSVVDGNGLVLAPTPAGFELRQFQRGGLNTAAVVGELVLLTNSAGDLASASAVQFVPAEP